MLDFRRQADGRQSARRQVEAEGFNVLFAGAGEDQFLLGLRAGRHGQQKAQQNRSGVVESHILWFDGHDGVVPLAFAQQQMFAKEQIGRREKPLRIGFSDIVDINAASFDVLPRLAF